jgi:ribosomal 50S subunit-associated protein YjgA (DUF615 family)
VKLRQQLQFAEAALRLENPESIKAELDAARQRIRSLEDALKELEQRIEEG